MRRVMTSPCPIVLLACLVTGPTALAQNDKATASENLPQARAPRTMSVPKDTTPPQPAAAQPSLPAAAQASPPKPGSPVVEEIVKEKRPVLDVRKSAAVRAKPKRRKQARRRGPSLGGLDRPALAGVELVAPLPPPSEPPHFTVPAPAFPLESVASAYLTPPPPIICHPARRDPDAPDPHLYKERPVICEADNP